MRLLTYNFLQCPKTKTFPLILEPTQVETIETEYNKEFILRMIPRLDWNLVRQVSRQFAFGELPQVAPKESTEDEETFRLLHKMLLETHIKEGVLKSQDGTIYPIKDGIPNMLITQVNDE
ncbi:Multifunctional methyltransferase subunit TRM112-like protein [Galdieria sulphuraria]|uniref:Multifunctional methyltransferase subunit TRM112-like protein n=1 Tax=Galdieria sulphuraria TaxID=130081 RepID=M2Y3T4_GALSU|nr:uncharacterized protein Gasu_20870 [Galdieria sulphuraria]EME30628.1 hypothetical protein Gasu_20870 [Galdieria sulphuraria]GJD09025.1 Multifunctional methyltransferase subunit TRM112-like protein [Galdieria sulphuraria]|eukprot:XP_005707148.1 hypothetical protein Gasu_20870 [Galdieria sulphuraria]